MMGKKRSRRRSRKKPPTPKKKASRTLLDIIMPVYGEWAMLERAIAAVDQACFGIEGGYRIFVVDNGTPEWRGSEGNILLPKEQSASVREALRPQDQFIRLEQNMGYPGAINHALGKGSSPLILIWTADVVMTLASITEMVRVLDDPDVGVVGAKLLFPTDESPHGPPGMIQHAGIALNIEGFPFHVNMGWPPEHPKVNIQREVMAVTGAIFLTRRNLLAQTGGFNTEYGVGTFEDMDFCFAVRERMGKKIVYCPTAWGYHYVGGSIKKGANTMGFNLSLNSTIFRGKWAGALQWDEWRYW